MKRLIVSLSDVPRTGRTTFAELLREMMRSRRIHHMMVHTASDQPGGAESGHYMDTEGGLKQEDFIALLDEWPVVLMDLATGEAADFAQFYEESELGELLGEMDTALTLVLPVTASKQTEQGLLHLADIVRHDADYVLLRSAAALGADWAVANAGRAMHHLGAWEVPVPALPKAVIEYLGETGTPLATAVVNSAMWPRAIGTMLEQWKVEYAGTVEPIGDILLPPTPVPAAVVATASVRPAARRAGRPAATASKTRAGRKLSPLKSPAPAGRRPQ